jgi:antitoxin ParD1/3/4
MDTKTSANMDSPDGDTSRAGRRLHEAKIRALQAALIAGEKSGKAKPFDFAAFIAGKRAVRLNR